MEISFSRANNDIDQLISRLLELSGEIHHPVIIREMLLSRMA